MSENESLDNSVKTVNMNLLITYIPSKYNVTISNSFGGGIIKVDGANYSSGTTLSLTRNTPHTVEAIDNQSYGEYGWKFSGWKKDQSQTDLPISFTIQNLYGPTTYQAVFDKLVTVKFRNNMGGEEVGKIRINDIVYDMPIPEFVVKSGTTFNFSPVDETRNYVVYHFNYWTDNNTPGTNSSIFRTTAPVYNTTYIAHYLGTPTNVNITSYLGNDYDPITITWDNHPNANVTQYQVWRSYKRNGVVYGPSLITTLNRPTNTYTDNDFLYLNRGQYLMQYDIRAYLSIEGTYSTPNWLQMYGMMYKRDKEKDSIKQAEKNNTYKPFQYSVCNYPNPCNPSTTFNLEIPEAGNIKLKVFDIMGREIVTLLDKYMDAGRYDIKFDGNNLPSGTYIYKMDAGSTVKTGKILLMK